MEKISSINFKAQPLNNIKVQKFCKKSKSFVPINTTFVKIDAKNKYDLAAVEAAAEKWKDAKYMKKIATASHWMNAIPIEIYALTTQEKNFNKLDYKRILGFAEMRPDNNDERFTALYYLQVKPQAMDIFTPQTEKTYKKVGSSILTSLKKVYKNISLFSEDNTIIKMFYKKNGFINDANYNSRFLWSSSIFFKLRIYYENLRKSLALKSYS